MWTAETSTYDMFGLIELMVENYRVFFIDAYSVSDLFYVICSQTRVLFKANLKQNGVKARFLERVCAFRNVCPTSKLCQIFASTT